MPFEDIMMKLADGKPLSQLEKEELRLQTKNISNVVELSKTWQRVGENKINSSYIDFPVDVIYSKQLEEHKTSVFVEIPSRFKNITIHISGKSRNTHPGSTFVQFNGDTGTSYQWEILTADNTVVSATRELSQTHAYLGKIGGWDDPSYGGIVAEITNNSDNADAGFLSRFYRSASDDIGLIGASWGGDSNGTFIKTIEIYVTDNTLVKGTASIAQNTIISIYGYV